MDMTHKIAAVILLIPGIYFLAKGNWLTAALFLGAAILVFGQGQNGS